jgi:hypothetical protein
MIRRILGAMLVIWALKLPSKGAQQPRERELASLSRPKA